MDAKFVDFVPDRCPNCRKRLPGTLSIKEVRHHLDGHCVPKTIYARDQVVRKENPKLPGM